MLRMSRFCEICGGAGYDMVNDKIIHRPECPNHPDAIDDTPIEPIVRAATAPVASIASARFDRAVHCEDVSPRDAIVAALEWVDKAEAKPAHVIVMIGQDTPGKATASGTKFFQAGTYRHHAQMGLCLEAMHLIRESG